MSANDTLKEGNEKEPVFPNRVAPEYRPAYSAEHFVTDKDSWKSLGERYRLSPGFIIDSNFKTNDPEEINWYLRNYVKCTKPTADRYNWRFSTSSRNGGGPHAGKIYIVPNWFAIGIAAKIQTRYFVSDFFKATSLDPCVIDSTNLVIRQGTVRSTFNSPYFFATQMKLGGAPDELADIWADTLVKALTLFVESIDGLAVDVFPQFLQIPRGYPAGPSPAKSFKLLAMESSMQGVLESSYFENIAAMARLDSPAATIAMKHYGLWFEKSFAELRKNAVATYVMGKGLSNPHTGIFSGYASAYKGFLAKTNLL